MEKEFDFGENLIVPENIPLESWVLLVFSVDKKGLITRVHSGGGLLFSAGNINVSKNITPRESTRWQNALDKLLEMGYIEDKGTKNEVFDVTYAGIEMAKLVKKQKMLDFSKDPQDILNELAEKNERQKES